MDAIAVQAQRPEDVVFDDYEDEQDPEVKGPWQITDNGSASWAMQRYGDQLAEIARIDEMERATVARTKAAADKLRAKAQRGVAFFETRLLVWAERERPRRCKGKAKSFSVLSGVIGWRARAERLEVTDKTALEPWLREQPAGSPLVRVKLEPVMGELQKLLKEAGEIPPGCSVSPAAETPYLKPSSMSLVPDEE